MARTYRAILRGNRVDWTDADPDLDHPVPVQITLLEAEAIARERGQEMAEALRKLAEIDAFSDVEDPVEWQREIRADRPLPGRKP